jgi:hypothetical protein
MAEIGSTILKDNLQDMSIRQGMVLGGWKPKIDDMAAQAVDWLRGGSLTFSFKMLILHIHITNRHRRGKCLPCW